MSTHIKKEIIIAVEFYKNKCWLQGEEMSHTFFLPYKLRRAIGKHGTVEFIYDADIRSCGDDLEYHTIDYSYTWINSESSEEFKEFAEFLLDNIDCLTDIEDEVCNA